MDKEVSTELRTEVFKPFERFRRRPKLGPEDVCKCKNCNRQAVAFYPDAVKNELRSLPAVSRERLKTVRDVASSATKVIAMRLRAWCDDCSCTKTLFFARVVAPTAAGELTREVAL